MKTDNLDLTPRKILSNLYHIKHADPGALRMGISTNTYVLTSDDDKALLIDPGFKYLSGPLKEILSNGLTLAGVLFTHRHIVANGNFLSTLINEFDIPLLLHPMDQNNLHIRRLPYSFEDPVNHALVHDFDVEVLHFPGHTEGSVLLYQQTNGGLVISGDSAMGPSEKQIKSGEDQLVRPPKNTCVDDKQLREQWQQFKRPFAHFTPYHGGTIINKPEAWDELLISLRSPEPTRVSR